MPSVYNPLSFCPTCGLRKNYKAMTCLSCMRASRRDTRPWPEIAADPKTLERFMKRVDQSSASGCWLWTGGKSSDGYAQVKIGGNLIRVNRLSFMIFNGLIPEGHGVLHQCDVRICVNPDHLFTGTQKDNMMDCASKARSGNSPLAEDDVREIRRLYAQGGISQKSLALRFGCGQMTINRIVRGLRWKHVA